MTLKELNQRIDVLEGRRKHRAPIIPFAKGKASSHSSINRSVEQFLTKGFARLLLNKQPLKKKLIRMLTLLSLTALWHYANRGSQPRATATDQGS